MIKFNREENQIETDRFALITKWESEFECITEIRLEHGIFIKPSYATKIFIEGGTLYITDFLENSKPVCYIKNKSTYKCFKAESIQELYNYIVMFIIERDRKVM